MAAGHPIATVVAVIGTAFVRDSKGHQRVLKPGDVLKEGDVVITPDGAKVELAMGDTSHLFIEPRQTVAITAELSDTTRPDRSEAELGSGTVDRVIQALNQGGSLDNLIEDPAAGNNGGGAGNEGSNFVRLLRIAEALNPLGFEFGGRNEEIRDDLRGGFDSRIPDAPHSDGPQVGTVSSPTVVEGGNLDFAITLTNASTTPTTVTLTPNGVTATLGTDTSAPLVSFDGGLTFNPIVGSTVTVPANTTSFVVRYPTVDDALDEPNETMTLGAATAQNAAPVVGTGTITDNDGTPTLSINDVTVNEAAGTATFTVTLSAASGQAVSVGYNTSNVTATAGSDYTSTTGTLTFAPGVTTQTITVAIGNDNVFEGSETFNVNLVTPTNATIADGLGIGTIRDDGTGPGGTDNDTPTLSVSSPTVAESAGFAVFTVSLSNPSAFATSVSLALANGTATSPSDYTTAMQVSTDGGATWTAATTATIAAGQTSVLVRTPVINDILVESNETFNLTATRTSGTTTNASATGIATITDNDHAPVALADTRTTLEDIATSANVLSNDTDADGNTLSVTQFVFGGTTFTVPAGGSVTGTVAGVGSLLMNSNGNYTFTPATNYSGSVPTVTYTVTDGANPVTSTLNISVTPVADTPTLSVANNPVTVLFNTGWETAANSNTTSEQVAGPTLEGWTLITSPDSFTGGTNAFEIWTSGDDQARQDGNMNVIVSAPGDGRNFLELNNASNLVQTLGISRSVSTQAGMVYDLTFDYAGRPGFTAAYTQISVLLDGVTIATYSNTSPMNSLDWKNVSLNFMGDGGTHTLSIVTSATQFNSAGRGAMLDNITLFGEQGVTAGNAGGGTLTNISLANYITAGLVDTDGSELLTLSFANLPTGARIITSSQPGGIVESGGNITINGIDLASAVLQIDGTFRGELEFNVSATATEQANGATATTAVQTVDINVVNATGVITSVDLVDGTNANTIYGTAAGETVNGTAGNDVLVGLAGNDTLNGSGGNDLISGGAGNDTMNGGTGSDTFIWKLADRGTPGTPATDTITAFNTAAPGSGGDILDLRDLLVGELHSGSAVANLSNYLQFQLSGANTVVHVSSTGGFSTGYVAGNEDQTITLQGVNLLSGGLTNDQVIQNLLTQGKLITD